MKNPRDDFGTDEAVMEYGFVHNYDEDKVSTPPILFAQFSKTICYSPKFRDHQREDWAKALLKDRWFTTFEPICLHWGERLIKDDGTGKQRCPACPKKCDICGHWKLKMPTRFGSDRSFESYRDLRLFERREIGWALEIQDLNCVNRPPPQQQLRPRSLYSSSLRHSRHSVIEENFAVW